MDSGISVTERLPAIVARCHDAVVRDYVTDVVQRLKAQRLLTKKYMSGTMDLEDQIDDLEADVARLESEKRTLQQELATATAQSNERFMRQCQDIFGSRGNSIEDVLHNLQREMEALVQSNQRMLSSMEFLERDAESVATETSYRRTPRVPQSTPVRGARCESPRMPLSPLSIAEEDDWRHSFSFDENSFRPAADVLGRESDAVGVDPELARWRAEVDGDAEDPFGGVTADQLAQMEQLSKSLARETFEDGTTAAARIANDEQNFASDASSPVRRLSASKSELEKVRFRGGSDFDEWFPALLPVVRPMLQCVADGVSGVYLDCLRLLLGVGGGT